MLKILTRIVFLFAMVFLPQALSAETDQKFILLTSSSPTKKTATVTYEQMFNAIQSNKINDVKRFIKNGIDLDERDKYGNSYLHHCDNTDILQIIVNAGADINAGDRKGVTPLHYAVKENNWKNVSFLLRSRAMVNKQDNSGLTPLHYIGFAGKSTSKKTDYDQQIAILEILLRRGADVKITGKSGETVLHLLTADYKVDIRYDDLLQRIKLTKILLKHGADINAKDNYGWSLMHYAAYNYKNADTVDEKGYTEWFEYLIANGIKIDTTNNKGETSVAIMTRARGLTPSVKMLMTQMGQ